MLADSWTIFTAGDVTVQPQLWFPDRHGITSWLATPRSLCTALCWMLSRWESAGEGVEVLGLRFAHNLQIL